MSEQARFLCLISLYHETNHKSLIAEHQGEYLYWKHQAHYYLTLIRQLNPSWGMEHILNTNEEEHILQGRA